MADTAIPEKTPGLWQRFRTRRREMIFNAGKRIRRPLRRYLARQSTVGDPPVFERELFDWVADLESAAPVIRRELDAILSHRDRLPPFQTISKDNYKIAREDQWKVFILYGIGDRSERNCSLCPETARVLSGIPGIKTAWFSILSPRYHVPPHKGITKGLIRCHLGLIVPDDKENCRMRVGTEFFHWDEGRCVVFDDSRKHEVWNDTDQERVVLLLDVERPMRFGGRMASRLFLRLLRFTGYFRDARRSQLEWEDRFHGQLAAEAR